MFLHKTVFLTINFKVIEEVAAEVVSVAVAALVAIGEVVAAEVSTHEAVVSVVATEVATGAAVVLVEVAAEVRDLFSEMDF